MMYKFHIMKICKKLTNCFSGLGYLTDYISFETNFLCVRRTLHVDNHNGKGHLVRLFTSRVIFGSDQIRLNRYLIH